MIYCTNVHKSYALASGTSVYALRGVDLQISEPGFYAIMGASGSGKSTLLHLLAALDSPEQGTISVAGKAIEKLSERELTLFRRRSIGIVFQQFNLIATLSARENVELPGMLSGDDPKKLAKRSAELLERLGLGQRMDHRPDSLSGGEQQRVAIARALLYQPPVLLADEPTGALDSANSAKLLELLSGLARECNMTIAMVTHEPSAAAHTKHVFVLRDGVMHGNFATENLDATGLAARYQQLVG